MRREIVPYGVRSRRDRVDGGRLSVGDDVRLILRRASRLSSRVALGLAGESSANAGVGPRVSLAMDGLGMGLSLASTGVGHRGSLAMDGRNEIPSLTRAFLASLARTGVGVRVSPTRARLGVIASLARAGLGAIVSLATAGLAASVSIATSGMTASLA